MSRRLGQSLKRLDYEFFTTHLDELGWIFCCETRVFVVSRIEVLLLIVFGENDVGFCFVVFC